MHSQSSQGPPVLVQGVVKEFFRKYSRAFMQQPYTALVWDCYSFQVHLISTDTSDRINSRHGCAAL